MAEQTAVAGARALREVLMGELGALRFEPLEKRIRGSLGGRVVVDSTRALLVWEPRRVVPTYAVPASDVAAEVVPAGGDPGPRPEGVAAMGAPRLGDRVVYDPSVPFAHHTAPGEALAVRAPGTGMQAAAFRPADPLLRDYVVLDFDGFDAWYEEDEPNVGHPRDPFHRIDILHSSRHVRVELEGEVLADSSRPYLLFEPPLPVRHYLPAEDVRTDLLQPSETTSVCAYKGHASYLSRGVGRDVAWTYLQPLREAAEIAHRIAFFSERVDIAVDGRPLGRPVTPWSGG